MLQQFCIQVIYIETKRVLLWLDFDWIKFYRNKQTFIEFGESFFWTNLEK